MSAFIIFNKIPNIINEIKQKKAQKTFFFVQKKTKICV